MTKLLFYFVLFGATPVFGQFSDFCQGAYPYNATYFTAYKTKGYKTCKVYSIEGGKKSLYKEIVFNAEGLPVSTKIYGADNTGQTTATQTEEYTYSKQGLCTGYKNTYANDVVSIDEKYVYNNKMQLIQQTDQYDLEKKFTYKPNNTLDSIYSIDYNREEDENGKPIGERYIGSIFVTTHQFKKANDTLVVLTENVDNDEYGYKKYPFLYEEYVLTKEGKIAEYYLSRAMSTFTYLYKYAYTSDGVVTKITTISTMDEETTTVEYVYEYFN